MAASRPAALRLDDERADNQGLPGAAAFVGKDHAAGPGEPGGQKDGE